jgi:hypothetical protein
VVSASSHGSAILGGLRCAGGRAGPGVPGHEGLRGGWRWGVAEITAVRKSQLFRHARPEPNTVRKRLTWYG